MNTEKDNTNKEEYIFEINEGQRKVIKKLDKETNQEIKMIFETETDTDVMSEILNQLSKYYVKDILKL